MDFGVRLSRAFMPAGTDDPAAANEHTAYSWIGTGSKQPFFGKPQCQGHMAIIGRGEHGYDRTLFSCERASQLRGRIPSQITKARAKAQGVFSSFCLRGRCSSLIAVWKSAAS